MSGESRRLALVVSALTGLCAIDADAQTAPSVPPPSEDAQDATSQTTSTVTPHRRSLIERVIYKLDDGYLPLSERPGIGFEGQSALYHIMRELAA